MGTVDGGALATATIASLLAADRHLLHRQRRQHLREAARLDPRDPAARQLLAELERLPQ